MAAPPPDKPNVKIATFNINGLNARLSNLLAWLTEETPDVVCLQEIKLHDADFPAAEIERAGYGAIWRGQGAHHGVAILARGVEPLETRRTLPGDESDQEARYIEAAVSGVLVGCLYLPNGNPQPGPKFAYKLAWFERLIAHAAALEAADVPAVLAGDFNVVPTDQDIYDMRSWRKNALTQPAPREAFARLIAQGWTDALGDLHPDERPYTFWAYLRDSWSRDAGLRIDHLLVSRSIVDRLVDAGVDREVRGVEGASDHAPAWIEVA
ncbi:MAG: exodeoxyribonuclease III [Caulobacteraceae bacterium]|nr:exodeoxyribonuclease III [Caulobacter sp.]